MKALFGWAIRSELIRLRNAAFILAQKYFHVRYPFIILCPHSFGRLVGRVRYSRIHISRASIVSPQCRPHPSQSLAIYVRRFHISHQYSFIRNATKFRFCSSNPFNGNNRKSFQPEMRKINARHNPKIDFLPELSNNLYD